MPTPSLLDDPSRAGLRPDGLVAALAAVALPSRYRVLAAEAAGMLRWSLDPATGSAPVPAAVLDTAAAASRLVAVLDRLGVSDGRVHADPARGRWRVLVGPAYADDVARRTGLVDARGRRVAGLAPWLAAGSLPEAVAAWRGALLAAGRLAPADEPTVVLPCPTGAVATAMTELGRRLGLRPVTADRADRADSADRADRADGTPTVVVDGPGEVALLLASCGGGSALAAAGLAGPDDAGSANETRAAVAASRSTSTVADAFAVLEAAGVAVPGPLASAGRLRLRHPALGLVELAALAEEPISKDALAGRLRRLTVLAERHRRAGERATRRTS